jgi:hypothetical protein
MRTDEIIPYERNARRNDKAALAVAESIKAFGFRGSIVLESRENPIIVCGHTRWKACKLLGLNEIPDRCIEFADDLTPEQIKAFRIVDNKTAEIAKWDMRLLGKEVDDLLTGGGFDFQGMGFDFGRHTAGREDERLRTDKTYNLDLVGLRDCVSDWQMPRIAATGFVPDRLIGFNYARTAADKEAAVHFFIDDYQFERVWSEPRANVDVLSAFPAVLTPDFSMYMDMPLPMAAWNSYRSKACGRHWQKCGLVVIPTLSWAGPNTYGFAFEGIEPGGVVAASTVGVMHSQKAQETWRAGMDEALRRLSPKTVLLYGTPIDFDNGAADVKHYANSVTERMRNGRQRRKERQWQDG